MFNTKIHALVISTSLITLLTSCSNPQYKPGVTIDEQRIYKQTSSSSINRPGKLNDLVKDSEAKYELEQKNRPLNQMGNPNSTSYNSINNQYAYQQWLSRNSYRSNQVNQYLNYLSNFVDSNYLPPPEQILSTARSWEKCGYEQFQLPPQYLWSNMARTIRLYADLKRQGVIPASAEIRSAYRSPGLNACAGGAPGSKHKTNSAIDIWVPEYEGRPWENSLVQDKLCQFWSSRGESYNFGLGLYATGSIHLDTEGHRYWGLQYSRYDSPCRYLD